MLAEMRVLNTLADTVRRRLHDLDYGLARMFAGKLLADTPPVPPPHHLACLRSRWPSLSAWCGHGLCTHRAGHLLAADAPKTLTALRLTSRLAGRADASLAAVAVLTAADAPSVAPPLQPVVSDLQWPQPATAKFSRQLSELDALDWEDAQQAAALRAMAAEDHRQREWQARERMWGEDTRRRDRWRSGLRADKALEQQAMLSARDFELSAKLEDMEKANRARFLDAARRQRAATPDGSDDSDSDGEFGAALVPPGGVVGVPMAPRNVDKGVNRAVEGGLLGSSRLGSAWCGPSPPAPLPSAIAAGAGAGAGAGASGDSCDALQGSDEFRFIRNSYWGVAHPVPRSTATTAQQIQRRVKQHALRSELSDVFAKAKANADAVLATEVSQRADMVSSLARYWTGWYTTARADIFQRAARWWRTEVLLWRGAINWAEKLAAEAEAMLQAAEEQEVRKQPWLRPVVVAVRAKRQVREEAARERLKALANRIGAAELGGNAWDGRRRRSTATEEPAVDTAPLVLRELRDAATAKLTSTIATSSPVAVPEPPAAPSTATVAGARPQSAAQAGAGDGAGVGAGVGQNSSSALAQARLERLPYKLRHSLGFAVTENSRSFLDAALQAALPQRVREALTSHADAYISDMGRFVKRQPFSPPAAGQVPGPFQCMTCDGITVCRSCSRLCHR